MTQSSNLDNSAIDAALSDCRQGDCVVGEHWFVHRFSPGSPLTDTAAGLSHEETDLAEDLVAGLVILTQTCDIVRSCEERPYLEIAPLVEVDDREIRLIERCRRPRYAYVPGVADCRLVVDLDRVMTIEKTIAVGWERILGCNSDQEAVGFAHALSRKRARFAFPNDFSDLVGKLQDRLQEKHDKKSDEGEGLRSLRELRVQASPSWNSNPVDLMFWCIQDQEDEDFDGQSGAEFLKKWLALVPPVGRYRSVDMVIMALEDMTAQEYVDSFPLDLDHVSTRPK